jgi:very-short-patch-repair endonuclease
MHHYPHYLTELSRSLRARSTSAEKVLWEHLRGRRPAGLKFRRQQRFGRFIVDVYCSEHKLAIELEGGIHADPGTRQYDSHRFQFLDSLGLGVIRISNEEVLESTEKCLERIIAESQSQAPPLPHGETGSGPKGQGDEGP